MSSPPPDPDARPYGRRTFLLVTAGGLSALVWAAPAWRAVSALLPHEVRALGSPGGWRIYTVADSMPRFDPERWRLRVDGLVERPLTLSYRELLALPRAEQVSDFHCVTGWSVRNVHWAGVRLADLLERIGVHPRARALHLVSSEKPYTDYLTLEQARLGNALLAYEMDSRPLPHPHGAPVRAVVPELYGYKNVKWVERITLVANPGYGFWEGLGYDRDGWIDR